jgi:hypothetical protein
MAKKLLNEATVRRFQSLANLKPINEMSYKEEKEEEKMEEGMYEAEKEEDPEDRAARVGDRNMPVKEAEEPEAAPEMPEMDDAPEMEAGADLDDVELTDEEAEALIALGEKLAAAMGEAGEEEAPEMEMDDAPEAPEAPMMEEDELMETLSEIDYVPSQTEIVNEVARRVARRLAEAQKAEKRMNEALGRK